MNYKAIYRQLVQKRLENPLKKQRCTGVEEHHILPKCMGGSNNKTNLVVLTYKEHFVAHHLLWKIYKTPQLAFAFSLMRYRNGRKSKINVKEYEKLRTAMRDYMSQKKKDNKNWLGRKHKDETKRKISNALKNVPLPKETVRKQHISRMKNAKGFYKVLQFTKDGKLIATYNSSREASRECHRLYGKKPNIRGCILYRNGSGAGFIWKYESMQ